MSKLHTSVAVILDRSGSMDHVKQDVEGGFNKLIEEQRKAEGTCDVTLVQFDSEAIDTVYTGMPVADVPKLDLVPRGLTPLLDAVARTIVDVRTHLDGLPAERKPDRVIVIIITDGQENASREYRLEQVRRLIRESQDDRQWQFVYLGANVDAFAEAGKYGIPSISAAPYDSNAGGVRAAFAACSENLVYYRSGGSYAFTADQRKRMKSSVGLPPPPPPIPNSSSTITTTGGTNASQTTTAKEETEGRKT